MTFRRFRFTHDSLVYFAGGIPFALLVARSAADILLTFIALLFLARCLVRRDWRWVRTPAYALLLALWGWALITSPFALHPDKAMLAAFIGLRLPLFFIALTYWVLRDARDMRLFAWFLGPTLFFMGADTALQWVRGYDLFHVWKMGERLTGPLHLPDAGSYIARLWFPAVGLFLWLAAGQPRRTLLVIACALFLIPWVILSGERSAALVFLVALIAAALFAGFHWPAGRKPVAWLLCLTLAGLAAAAWFNPFIHTRLVLLGLQLRDFGATPYGQLWKAALILWQSHPFAGIGANGFRTACQTLLNAGCDIHPHNTYLEWLADTGLIGLLLYIAFIVSLLKPSPLGRGLGEGRAAGKELNAEKLPHPDPLPKGEGVILAACMLGTYVMNFFPLAVTQGMFSNWSSMLLWFSLAVATALPRIYKNASASASEPITASA